LNRALVLFLLSAVAAVAAVADVVIVVVVAVVVRLLATTDLADDVVVVDVVGLIVWGRPPCFSCVCRCLVRLLFSMQAYSQSVHLCGFSPPCVNK
jgi:hypothetical protein